MTSKAARQRQERLKKALGVEETTPEQQATILLALHGQPSPSNEVRAAMVELSRLDAALSPVGDVDWRNPLLSPAEYLADVQTIGGTIEQAKHAALLKIIMADGNDTAA